MAKAPHISVGAASVHFDELEKLLEQARQTTVGAIYVGSVRVVYD